MMALNPFARLREFYGKLEGAAVVSDLSSTLASKVAGKFATAVILAVSARRLGPRVFGAYIAINTYLILANAFVDFGLSPFVTRAISEGRPPGRVVLTALGIRGALSLLLSAVGVAVVIALPVPPEFYLPVVYSTATVLFDLATDVFLAALRGRGEFGAIAANTVLRSVVMVAGASACLLAAPTLAGLTFAFLTAAAATFGGAVWQARGLFRWTRLWPTMQAGARTRGLSLRAVLAPTWAFGVSAILCSLYMRIGPAVLARSGAVEMGIYGAAYKIIEASLFAPSIFCSILLPYLAATRTSSPREYGAMIEGSIKLLVTPAFLLANVLVVIAEPLIRLLYGDQFAPAAGVLQVLTVFFLMTAITGGVQSAVLMSLGEMKFMTLLMGGALAAAVPLNLLLTTQGGAWGAAVACCLGEALVFVCNLIYLERRSVPAQSRLLSVYVVLTAAAVAAQRLPQPASLLVPIATMGLAGWRCLADLRGGLSALSRGRRLLVELQCE